METNNMPKSLLGKVVTVCFLILSYIQLENTFFKVIS